MLLPALTKTDPKQSRPTNMNVLMNGFSRNSGNEAIAEGRGAAQLRNFELLLNLVDDCLAIGMEVSTMVPVHHKKCYFMILGKTTGNLLSCDAQEDTLILPRILKIPR